MAALALLLGTGLPAISDAAPLACGQAPYASPEEVSTLVAEMQPVFAAFPAFEDTLLNSGVELCIADSLIDAQGYFEPDSNRIVINGDAPVDLQQTVLLHELRHVQQHMTEVCPAPDLSMQEYARAVMAMEADASAINALVAWALKEAGNPAMWNALSSWPLQQDIAAAFAAAFSAESDVATATEAAFSQWFENQKRFDAYYLAACSSFLEVEDRSHRLRSYEELDTVFFDDLCRLPNGLPYRCNAPR